jgi:hypothetical protein
MTPEEFKKRAADLKMEIVATIQSINTIVQMPGIEQEDKLSVNNLLLHSLITYLDILVGVKYIEDCRYNKNEYEEYYFARVLAVVCFDIFDTMNKFENSFSALRKNPGTADIIKRLSENKDKLSELKNIYSSKVTDIRHHFFAHRDEFIGFAQNKGIKEMNTADMYVVSRDILNIRREQVGILNELRKVN